MNGWLGEGQSLPPQFPPTRYFLRSLPDPPEKGLPSLPSPLLTFQGTYHHLRL